MPKHILFLIHGIGVHEPGGWAEELAGPIDTLKKISQRYAYFQNKPLDQRVEFAPLHYDDIFQEITSQWQADAAMVNQIDPTGVLAGSLSWMEHCAEKEKNFWWSHAADAAMYRLSPVYRQRVRTQVIEQLATRVEQEMNSAGSATCSVLAHSMGTAVAHDCLHWLGVTRWGGSANPLSPAHWRFQHLFMVANTSRCLQSDVKAYESIVRPGPVEDPTSYCATYWNIRHEADPVAFVRMFEPAGWPKTYTQIIVRHFREANIHGFSHYLQNPAVHIPILRKLTRPDAVTRDEEIAAVDGFPQFGGDLAFIEKAKRLRADLEQIKLALGEEPAVKDWIAGMIDYYKTTERGA